MAKVLEMGPDQLAAWTKWVAERPPVIQAMCKSHPPDRLYKLSQEHGGQRVIIMAYGEDGTVRVAVSALYNVLIMERQVFGIPISALTECDLPPPDEPIGQLLKTKDAQLAFINQRRGELGNPPLTEWPGDEDEDVE